jgi:hypothetical protein
MGGGRVCLQLVRLTGALGAACLGDFSDFTRQGGGTGACNFHCNFTEISRLKFAQLKVTHPCPCTASGVGHFTLFGGLESNFSEMVKFQKRFT